MCLCLNVAKVSGCSPPIAERPIGRRVLSCCQEVTKIVSRLVVKYSLCPFDAEIVGVCSNEMREVRITAYIKRHRFSPIRLIRKYLICKTAHNTLHVPGPSSNELRARASNRRIGRTTRRPDFICMANKVTTSRFQLKWKRGYSVIPLCAIQNCTTLFASV